MIAYKYDSEKKYAGEVECQLDPLTSQEQGKDVWLLPADSTFEKPLKEKEGYYVVWKGSSWSYEEIPVEQEPHIQTEDEKKEAVRSVRNYYLNSTDYTQLSDAPFYEDEKASYREYRQYLRDYTKQDNWWEQEPKNYTEWGE